MDQKMRDIIKTKLSTIVSTEEKYNVLREYLQAMLLKSIESTGYMKNIVFVGGTALRFLFDLNRFSEDLDFSLINNEGFIFDKMVVDLVRAFEGWNIKVETKPKAVKTVASSFFKFPELMFENGLTDRKNQKLFIKLEVDCKPPTGFMTELSFNQKYMPMNVLHYDLSSLFAGKLHAVLFRQYTKGRDFYDLMWFLGKKVVPNLIQLENAIFQTTGERLKLEMPELKERLRKRIEEVDFKKIHDELRVFVADKSELDYLNVSNLTKMLSF